jgi:MFS family permease
LGFAFLALDFILRILIIEKKTAARYNYTEEANDEPSGHISEEQSGEGEDGHEASEEDPLIRKKEENTYKVSSDQSRAVRAFPLLVCLKNPRLLTALLLAFVQATLLGTFDATIPTVAQDYFGFSSLRGGLLFMALVLPYLVLGPVAGWAVDRYGAKPAAVIGFGYLAPVLVLLRLVQPGGKPQVIIYCVLLALCGMGMGVIGSPSIVEAAHVVQMYQKANPDFFGEQGPYAQLYSINSMVFSLGLTVGPLVSGLLRGSIGYGNMNLVVAALCFTTAVLSFIYVGGKPNIVKKKR